MQWQGIKFNGIVGADEKNAGTMVSMARDTNRSISTFGRMLQMVVDDSSDLQQKHPETVESLPASLYCLSPRIWPQYFELMDVSSRETTKP